MAAPRPKPDSASLTWADPAGAPGRDAGADRQGSGSSPGPAHRRVERGRRQGLTLLELLVVMAILAVLASLLLPGLGRAKAAARRLACLNHQRQLSLAMHMYVHDNAGRYCPRTHPNRWPQRLLENYRDLKLLVCPQDDANPATGTADPALWPADAAPRSYIYNAWNDYYRSVFPGDDWRQIVSSNGHAIREWDIREPSATCVFGEKQTDSTHWYLDYERLEDLTQLDQARHGGGPKTGKGSNYAFADGSVRFVPFGRTIWPVNLWATTPEARRAGGPLLP